MTVSPYGNLGFREGFGASSWFGAESCWALGGTGRPWGSALTDFARRCCTAVFRWSWVSVAGRFGGGGKHFDFYSSPSTPRRGVKRGEACRNRNDRFANF